MAQVEDIAQNPLPQAISETLFSDHLKCSICLDTLRIPIMTTIGCGHRFCEEDIKNALTEDRRCPLCREQVRELFHDVFAEQMLEVYYKLNPSIPQREKCPIWTAPNPLADINVPHRAFRGGPTVNISVQVTADLTQAERNRVAHNIAHIIERENRFEQIAAFDPDLFRGNSPISLRRSGRPPRAPRDLEDEINFAELNLAEMNLAEMDFEEFLGFFASGHPSPSPIHPSPQRRRGTAGRPARTRQTARMSSIGRPRPGAAPRRLASTADRIPNPGDNWLPGIELISVGSRPVSRPRSGPDAPVTRAAYSRMTRTPTPIVDGFARRPDLLPFPATRVRASMMRAQTPNSRVRSARRSGTPLPAGFVRGPVITSAPATHRSAPSVHPGRARAQPVQSPSVPTVSRSGRVSKRPNYYGSN